MGEGLGNLGRESTKLTRRLLFAGKLADRLSGCGTGTLDCRGVHLWAGRLLMGEGGSGRGFTEDELLLPPRMDGEGFAGTGGP